MPNPHRLNPVLPKLTPFDIQLRGATSRTGFSLCALDFDSSRLQLRLKPHLDSEFPTTQSRSLVS